MKRQLLQRRGGGGGCSSTLDNFGIPSTAAAVASSLLSSSSSSTTTTTTTTNRIIAATTTRRSRINHNYYRLYNSNNRDWKLNNHATLQYSIQQQQQQQQQQRYHPSCSYFHHVSSSCGCCVSSSSLRFRPLPPPQQGRYGGDGGDGGWSDCWSDNCYEMKRRQRQRRFSTDTTTTAATTTTTTTTSPHLGGGNNNKYPFIPHAIYQDAPPPSSSTNTRNDKNNSDSLEWYYEMNPNELHVKYHMKNQYVQSVGQQLLSIPKSSIYQRLQHQFKQQQKGHDKERATNVNYSPHRRRRPVYHPVQHSPSELSSYIPTTTDASSQSSSSSSPILLFYDMEYGTSMKILRTILDRRVDTDHNHIPNIKSIKTPFTVDSINIALQLLERVVTEFTLLDQAYTQISSLLLTNTTTNTNNATTTTTTTATIPLSRTNMRQIQQALRQYIRTTNIYRNFFTTNTNINRLLHVWKELSLQQIEYYQTITVKQNRKQKKPPRAAAAAGTNKHTTSRRAQPYQQQQPPTMAVVHATPIVSLQKVLQLLQFMSQYAMRPPPPPPSTIETSSSSSVLSKATFSYDTGTLGTLLQVLIVQLPSRYSAPLDVQEFIQTYYYDNIYTDDNQATTTENINVDTTNNMSKTIKDQNMSAQWSPSSSMSSETTDTSEDGLTTTSVSAAAAAAESNEPIAFVVPADIYIYSLVMKVWADSHRPETSEQLQLLLDQMRTHHNISPNEVIYGILLRYYAGKNNIPQMKAMYHHMEFVDIIRPNLACYAQVIYGYTKHCHTNTNSSSNSSITSNDYIEEACKVFNHMIASLRNDSNTNIRKSTPLFMSSAHNILDAYRKSIMTYHGSRGGTANEMTNKNTGSSLIRTNEEFTTHTNTVIQKAETFVRKLESSGILILDAQFGDSIRGVMMDIYARVGTSTTLQETQAIFNTMSQPDTTAHGILIKAYRKNNRADLADDLFQQKLLQDPNIPRVSINLFNSLIYAWAESTIHNAIERGLHVLRLIDKINRIQRYEKRKNKIMTHGNTKYIKEVHKSRITFDDFVVNDRSIRNEDDTSNYDRWEQRQKRSKLKKDNELVQSMFGDNAQYDIIPNTDTFTALLKCCADAGDGITFPVDMGKKVEGILLQMEQRASPTKSNDNRSNHRNNVDIPIELKVNPTTTHYVLAIRACIRAKELDVAESILRRMDINCTNPPPDVAVYNSILDQYAKFCSNVATQIYDAATTDVDDDNNRLEMIRMNSKAAHRASRILQYMINNDSLTDEGDKKSSASLNIQPNAVSYNRVLQCWSKSHDIDAVQHMWELYQQCARIYRLHSLNYKTDDKQRYRRQKPLPMNSVCFDTMIKFYTDTPTLFSMQKSLLLLQVLEKSDTIDLKPDPWHYTVIVKGFMSTKDFETASIVLRRAMERHFDKYDGSRPHSPINTIPAMLHSLVLAWIESNQLEKATQYVDSFITLQGSRAPNEESPCYPFDIVATLQALQTAWERWDAEIPDKYYEIDKLEQQMKEMKMALKSPQPSTITSEVPPVAQLVEPLPPLPDYSYEETPLNY